MTENVLIGSIVAAIVGGIALLAFLPKPRWLDRIWLGMIAVSFCLWVPLWIVFQIQDHGWQAFVTCLLGLFVLGFIRGWPASDGSSKSSSTPRAGRAERPR